MNGIAYCRVSTKEQRDNSESLDTQLQHIRDIMAHYSIIEAFTPIQEDASGYTLNRDGLQQLRSLMYSRRIQAVVINESSRLSREIKHGEELLDEMYEYGIRLFIYYPHRREMNLHPDSTDREMLLHEMLFNRKWGKMLKQQMSWGKEAKLSRGKFLGTGFSIYGYDWEGKRDEKHLVINKEHAKVARSILTWYGDDGDTSADIIRNLRGILTPGARLGLFSVRPQDEWSYSTVYTILNNADTYAGTYTYTYKGKTYAVDIPAIITRELAEKVKARLAIGREKSTRNTKHNYLMGMGRIVCGKCDQNGHMQRMVGEANKAQGNTYLYYECGTARGHRAIPYCGTKKTKAPLIDRIAWEYTKAILRNPKSMATAQRKQAELTRKNNAALYKRIEQLDRTIEKNNKALEKAVNDRHRTTSERILTMIDTDIQRLDELLNDLEKERTALINKVQTEVISDEAIDALERYAESIRDELEYMEFDAQRYLVELLGLTGTFRWEHNQPVIYLHYCMHTERFIIEDAKDLKQLGKGLWIDYNPSSMAGNKILRFTVRVVVSDDFTVALTN